MEKSRPKALTVSGLCAQLTTWFFSAVAVAQRDDQQYRSEGQLGEVYGSSDGGPFGTLLLIVFGALIVLGFIFNKYLRYFLIFYAALIGFLIFIPSFFEDKKEGIFVAGLALIAMGFYVNRRLNK